MTLLNADESLKTYAANGFVEFEVVASNMIASLFEPRPKCMTLSRNRSKQTGVFPDAL